jgi:hypothetical protein
MLLEFCPRLDPSNRVTPQLAFRSSRPVHGCVPSSPRPLTTKTSPTLDKHSLKHQVKIQGASRHSPRRSRGTSTVLYRNPKEAIADRLAVQLQLRSNRMNFIPCKPEVLFPADAYLFLISCFFFFYEGSPCSKKHHAVLKKQIRHSKLKKLSPA